MTDITRAVGVALQEGVRDVRVWSWWVFYVSLAESLSVRNLSIQIVLGRYSVLFAINSFVGAKHDR